MSKLQNWMTKNAKDDGDVAQAVKFSRPQISRIRRGKNAASPRLARALEKLTGIRWWNFVVKAKIKKVKEIAS